MPAAPDSLIKKWGSANPVFQGFFEKNGAKAWCFDGQFVVRCVVKMAFWMVAFESRKMGQAFEIYFLGKERAEDGCLPRRLS
jgi:hypothetical protein